MASIFSKIVAGEIPCYKIKESEKFLAFLDVFPVAKGHTLVIPKKEVDYVFDLDDETLGEMMLFAKEVAAGLKEAMPCERIGVSIIGLEVRHAHIHLIPINGIYDMNFEKEKLKLPQDEFQKIAESIISKL